jgi:hypothetical protein
VCRGRENPRFFRVIFNILGAILGLNGIPETYTFPEKILHAGRIFLIPHFSNH